VAVEARCPAGYVLQPEEEAALAAHDSDCELRTAEVGEGAAVDSDFVSS